VISEKAEPVSQITIRAVRSVSFKCNASQKLSSLFESFRLMCNDAIRIANNEKPKNRFNLIQVAYARLKEYGLHLPLHPLRMRGRIFRI
jgi:hypothetical protein